MRNTVIETLSCPDDLYNGSRAARAGLLLVRMAALTKTLQPLLTILALAGFGVLSLAAPAAAQQGGSLLNGNSQNPVNSIRTAIDVFVWVLIALGIGGIGWGIYNIMTDKAWGRQIVGGAAALGFGGIVAFINSLVNDEPVDLPEF